VYLTRLEGALEICGSILIGISLIMFLILKKKNQVRAKVFLWLAAVGVGIVIGAINYLQLIAGLF